MAAKYRALLIGNATYPADEHNLQPLKGPPNDLAALRRALTDQETGLFDEINVTLLSETTSSRALRAIGTFFGSAQREDVLLLYFSGHGKLDQLGRLHLCMQDTDSADLLATAVSSTRINEFAEASRARTLVVVLDCCYAGAFRGGEFSDAVAGPGRYVLTSCRGTQLANDATEADGTSHFTQHLVEGLVGAAVDRDHDGYVDFSDLYAYIDRRLRAEGKQIPQRKVAGDGDIALAKRQGAPTADPPPGPPVRSDPATGRARSAGRDRWIGRRTTLAGVSVLAAAGLLTTIVLLQGTSGSGGHGHVGTTPNIVDRQYSAASPWRLKIQDAASVDGDPGCAVAIRSASGTTIQLAAGIYDPATFQVAQTGALTLLKNESGCQLAPLAGPGSLPLPATVANSRGDTDAFAVTGMITVTASALTGSTCPVTLRNAADGTVLNFERLTAATQAHQLSTGAARAAYVQHSGCAVLIAAAR
ncbi:caspase family protein [Jatrophihabitans telluris]|uniref:Caspase family protein n=1 Tax=Jatrophihabitans telluris TaxID=2038343 RepID=A0ABY4QVS7_9ACTN|nr:caspase family protein [Jatrophihabitans telluris]UQX86971.1 caspase family protein [Jatrophihabitans telluris]